MGVFTTGIFISPELFSKSVDMTPRIRYVIILMTTRIIVLLCLRFFVPWRQDEESKDKPYDACRVHGSFEVNKVAGNFHITAGK